MILSNRIKTLGRNCESKHPCLLTFVCMHCLLASMTPWGSLEQLDVFL